MANSGTRTTFGSNGNTVDATSAADAILSAKLDWTVSTRDAWADFGGEWVSDPSHRFLCRDDTQTILSPVGSRYAPIQNRDAFAFLDHAMPAGATFHSAGAMKGGRLVWIQVDLNQSYEALAGDEFKNYLLFVKPHGLGAVKALRSSERLFCTNQISSLVRDARGRDISIRHTGNVRAKLADAQRAFEYSLDSMRREAALMRRLAQRQLTSDGSELGEGLAIAAPGESPQANNKRARIRRNFYHGQGAESGRGTAYNYLQAVTEYTTWQRAPKGGQTSRWASLVTGGTGAQMNERALTYATQLLAA